MPIVSRLLTGVAVGFALCAALVVGFVAGTWRERRAHASQPIASASNLAQRMVFPQSDSAVRAKDPEQWQRDSVLQARWRARPQPPPREIWRVQALGNCAIGFEVRDTTYGPLWLLTAEARAVRGRVTGLSIVSKGWTYIMNGLRPGDTVSIVLPNAFCSDIVIASIGGSLVRPPPPLRLDVVR